GIGDEVQLLSPRAGALTYTFAGRTGTGITFSAATTAQQIYANLISSFPALAPTNAGKTTSVNQVVTGNNPNIDVFGPTGGPFYVVFYNHLATTNVPQIISSQG